MPQFVIQDTLATLITQVMSCWLIIVDATQLYTLKNKNDEQCLTRTFTNKETGEKTTQYYHSVLEAKIVLGEDLVVSIASEFIENDGEDAKRQKNSIEG